MIIIQVLSLDMVEMDHSAKIVEMTDQYIQLD